MDVPVIVLILQRRAVERFLRAGCTRPEEARSPADLGLGDDGALRNLIHRGVLREAAPGRFWLDREAHERIQHGRHSAVLVALILGLVFLGLVWLLSS